MKNFKTGILSILLFAGVLVSCTNTGTKENPVKEAERVNDQKFEKPDQKNAQLLVDAWLNGNYVMRMADTARKFVTTDDGKRLAGMITDTYMKINDRIAKMAAAKQITLPADISDQQKRKLGDIENKKAKDLDKEFADAMVREQEDAIKLYEKSAADATDSDIKSFFTATLPELRANLDMAVKSRDVLSK